MKTAVKVLPILLGALLLAACAAPATKPDGAVVEDRGPDSGLSPEELAATAGAADPVSFALRSLEDPASPVYRRVFYFDYDSAELSSEDRETIAAHARLLSSTPGLTATLEGHADERGSREYNIGLGDRRAQAVRRMMTFQGVANEQLRTVSYGEERPAVFGHDESAWRLNRRVEIVYQGR
jgi:peptidoglycan-associated lipoprotein